MKRFIFLILFLLATCGFAIAQFTYEKSYGTIDDDEGFSLFQCDDNGYLIVGYTSNYYYGYPDMYVVRTNQSGSLMWSDVQGDPQHYDRAYDGIQTFDGGFAVCGPVDEANSSTSCIIKYDEDGNVSWTSTYPDQGETTPTSIKQTADSGFVFCGTARHSNKRSLWKDNPFILKTDKNGSLEWYTEIDEPYGIHSTYCIELAHNGGYVVCGQHDEIGENEDGWFFKIDESGEKVWDRWIGDGNKIELLLSVKKTNDNGYILCGIKHKSTIIWPGSGDFWLVKTDSTGIVDWEKTYGGDDTDWGYDVDLAHGGGYILTGSTSSYGSGGPGDFDVYVVRTDEIGDTIWTKTFGGQFSDMGRSVRTTTDGGYAISGMTRSMGNGGADVYLIKTDEDGIVTDLTDYYRQKNKLSIYPNPCTDKITIESIEPITEVCIFNANGGVVKYLEAANNSIRVSLSPENYRPGIYYVKVVTENQTFTQKLIIR